MNLIPLKPYGLKTITLNHDRLNIAFVDIDGTLTNDSRRKEQYFYLSIKVISLIVSCLRSKNNESYLF